MFTDFNNLFTVRTRNLWRIKLILRLPPQLYSVTNRSKTDTTADIDATCLIYWCYMAHKQCCVIVTLNKRHHTSDIGVFNMFTVILANTFDFFSRLWHHSLKLFLSMRHNFFQSVITALFSYFTTLNFFRDSHKDWGKYSSQHGISIELFWVNFKMFHIRNRSVLYMTTVCVLPGREVKE